MNGRRAPLAAIATVAVCGLVSTSAQAANTYVNDDGGSDSNDCTTQATPCATIAGAVGKTGAGETISVDGGAYTANNVNLESGRSLVELNFNTADGDTSAVVTGASNGGAIFVAATGAGQIRGFDFVHAADGFGALITLNGDATVDQNTFTGLASSGRSGIEIASDSDAIVTANNFSSTDGGTGIASTSTGSPQISSNTFSGVRVGIFSADGAPSISLNAITGIADPGEFSSAAAIAITGGSATIVRNSTSSPVASALANGIEISDSDTTSGPQVTATLSRNDVRGYVQGLRIANTAVDLNSDLAVGNRYGLTVLGDVATSVDAENVTLYDNELAGSGAAPADVRVSSAELTLDSAIVETPVVGNGTCEIRFSRGPTTSGTSCQQFQTTAAPGFVDPSSGDYHLAPLSPLIDVGNPALPVAPNNLDIDNDPRARNGDCNVAIVRDMGADEAGPRTAECDPPDTTIDSGPSGLTADTTPTFSFIADESGSSFECSVDGAAFGPCSGPGASHTTQPLAAGAHSFGVRAIDSVGNVDPSPATRDFTVGAGGEGGSATDSDPPETKISKRPAKRIETAKKRVKAKLRFSSDESGSGFECKLDTRAYKRCDSGRFKAKVKPGKHKFRVRAVDAAGNPDPTPAKARWRVVHD